MPLVNIGFAILLIKMLVCTLPAVLGIVMIVSSEESKREFRNKFCRQVFGVSNAIPSSKFTRTMVVLGTLLLAFSMLSSWFLLLRPMFLVE
ncbi:MAG: hypothetical protein VX372_00045 [Verrucomicrobiota bacterium]|nr:hypothetical protein [Verrucomicrobiota bacterium]MEE2987945.1 hypothetical protein [Verrucomicrobiota bacterium]